MKKWLVLCMAAVMMLSLGGCGKEKAPDRTPEAAVDPLTMDWGLVRDENVDNSSDLWYKNGDAASGEYIYFTNTLVVDCTAGCSFNRVVAEEDVLYAPCDVGEGEKANHLLPSPEGGWPDGRDFDLVFNDPFTAYDSVTETWYSRGDFAAMESAFSDMTFTNKERPENVIVFHADGTAVESFNSMEYVGTWRVLTPTLVRFNDGDYDYDFDAVWNEDGSLAGMDEYFAGKVSRSLEAAPIAK